jgi:hypothetical protein
MVITISPAATVNANADQTVCAASPNVTLAGSIGGSATSGTWSGGTGTFNPNNTTLNAVYTPTAAEITAGTITLTLTTNDPPGTCTAATDQMVITINPSPIVNAGPDQAVCASAPTITLAGSIGGAATSGTWSGGAGTFNPGNTSLNATYTPTAAEIATGAVTLVLTTDDPAGPCGPATDQLVISINPVATANANTDQTVCASSPNVTLAGSVGGAATSGTWSGGSGTFNPNNTALNATYTPSAAEITAGTVTLILTTNDPAGPCTAATDDVVITINPVATVSAGPPLTMCSDAGATMAGSFGGSATSATWTTSGSGTFSNNTPTAVYTPSAADITAGSVSLTYTTNDPAGPCPAVSASTTLTIYKAVVITTQPANTNVCASFPADLSVVAIGDGLTYQWYKGTPPTGVPVSNSANISGAQSPTLHFNQASLPDDGSYYVVISGTAPCPPVTSAVRTLNVDQAIIISTQPLSQTLCTGSSVTFTVVADANGDPLSYQWRKNGVAIPGATGATLTIPGITAADAGSYDVVITGPAGYSCSSAQSAIATLTVNLNSTLNLSSAAGTDAQTTCINTAITPITYSVGGGGTGASITAGTLPAGLTGSFNGGVFTIAGTPTASGSFNYTITTAGPCVNTSLSGTINVTPNSTINLSSAAGTDAQTACISTAITPITYAIGGGGTGATITAGALPPGLT